MLCHSAIHYGPPPHFPSEWNFMVPQPRNHKYRSTTHWYDMDSTWNGQNCHFTCHASGKIDRYHDMGLKWCLKYFSDHRDHNRDHISVTACTMFGFLLMKHRFWDVNLKKMALPGSVFGCRSYIICWTVFASTHSALCVPCNIMSLQLWIIDLSEKLFATRC